MPKGRSKSPAASKVTKPKTRKLPRPEYRSFRLSKRLKQPKPELTGAFRLLARSLNTLWKHRRLFGGILLVYFLLSLVFVKGFGVSTGINELKPTLLTIFEGSRAQLNSSLSLFSLLLSSTGSTENEVASVYQTTLLVVISLSLVWALRHTLSKTKTKLRIRDSFYRGMYPLVPFLLVLLVIGLQLLPLLIAGLLSNLVFGGGLAVTAIEQGLWGALFICLGLLSLYMVSSSVFAIYIVTLPDVTPMQALRSARDLVKFRRWVIMRKILFLPVALLVLAALLVIPIIIVSPNVAEWEFFIMSLAVLAVVHSYIYNLYRELL